MPASECSCKLGSALEGPDLRVARIVAWSALSVAAAVFVASLHPAVRSVYRAFRPSADYDRTPPELPELGSPAVLVFTKTNGFRHFEGIEAGVRAMGRIAAARGWSVYRTENGAVHDAGLLSRFRVVVWLNASGAPLDTSQRAALRQWLESGGGFVGIHAAVDNSHSSWEWYTREIVGTRFVGHPLDHQRAIVRVEKPQHPSMRGLGATWSHFDEWYSFDRSVRGDPGVEVVASVDEASYSQRLKFLLLDRDLSMGDHPVIWTRSVGAGRAFLSALGHVAEAYEGAGNESVLEGAIEWAGNLARAEPESPAPPLPAE